MDDLVEGLFGLFIGIAIAVALIMVIVYVVLPCAIIYFLGRTFYRQINTYRIVEKTQWVLMLIGLTSIGISTAIVAGAGINNLLIIPVSLFLFIALSVLTLGLWAFSKRAEFIKTRHLLQIERFRTEQKLKTTRKRLEHLNQHIEELKNEHGELIHHGEKLNGYLKELCMIDAQTYTIKIREWKEEVERMSVEEMAGLKKRLVSELKRHEDIDHYTTVENSIKLCLIKQREIESMSNSPVNALKRAEAEIEALQRELRFLERVRANIESKHQENERAYKRLLSSGIVLD